MVSAYSCGPTATERDSNSICCYLIPPTAQISFGFGTLITSVNIRDRWVCNFLIAVPLLNQHIKVLLPPPWVTLITISIKVLFIKTGHG